MKKIWADSKPESATAHEEGAWLLPHVSANGAVTFEAQRWPAGKTIAVTRQTGISLSIKPTPFPGDPSMYAAGTADVHSHPVSKNTYVFTDKTGLRYVTAFGLSVEDVQSHNDTRRQNPNHISYILTPEGIIRLEQGNQARVIAPIQYIQR
jgi:hypothetical protein